MQEYFIFVEKMLFETTICAPACPPGGALSIIRISGPDAFDICKKLFNTPGSNSALLKFSPNTTHPAWIYDKGHPLDQVIVSIFKAPNSYTGEDSIEISCHGSPYIQKRIMELLILNGAVAAKAGEFTQRAFLNGKLDLTQAEAVADLIAAETRSAHKLAINQMRGGISKDFKELRQKLIDITSLLELELDFSEEDVEFAKRDELEAIVSDIIIKAEKVYRSFELGNAIKNGIPVAIIGKPNVGKSTLLNHLLEDDKAIVSDIAGTTRDAIEDTVVINGVMFRFIDTAGLRETADVIENLGIRKTYQKIKIASLILLLVDARDETECITNSLKEIRKQIKEGDKHLFLIINKSDLVDDRKLDQISKSLKLKDKEYILQLSLKSGLNMDKLISMLSSLVSEEQLEDNQLIISNIRHMEAIHETIIHLERVRAGLQEDLPEDLIAHDLRQAAHYLGTITGEISNEEVLSNIFRNFCIGK